MRRLIQRFATLFTVAALAAVLGASGTAQSQALPPVLTITSPADGVTLLAGDIPVMVTVSGFVLVPPGMPNAPGQGHIHFFKDVDAPIAPGVPAVTAPGTYAATSATSHVWTGVTPGMHTFSVELVNNNHTPLDPPVVVKVTVTVQ